MRTKPTMRRKMLRSVLVAAFSAAVAFGALSASAETPSDTRADSHWPSVVTGAESKSAVQADSHWPSVVAGAETAGDDAGEIV